MPNYRYVVGREEIILSDSEHEQIVKSVKKGETKWVLRCGTLVISWNLVGRVRPTNDLTEDQERTRKHTPTLFPPEPTQKDHDRARQRICESRTALGWEHTDVCWCKIKNQ